MSERATHPYETGLGKNAANYVPLSPTGFLLRTASVYPDRLAVAYGERRYSWREVLERCRRPAAALTVLRTTASRLDGMTQYLADVRAQLADSPDHLGMVGDGGVATAVRPRRRVVGKP